MVNKENIKCQNCLKHFKQFESWEIKALGEFEKKYNPTHEIKLGGKGENLCSYTFQRKISEINCKECSGKIKTNQEGDAEKCIKCSERERERERESRMTTHLARSDRKTHRVVNREQMAEIFAPNV